MIAQLVRIPTKTFPLPKVIFLEWATDGCSVEFEADVYSYYGGLCNERGILRPHAPAWMRDEFLTWIAIQKERKRLGLSYLESEEMVIRRF